MCDFVVSVVPEVANNRDILVTFCHKHTHKSM